MYAAVLFLFRFFPQLPQTAPANLLAPVGEKVARRTAEQARSSGVAIIVDAMTDNRNRTASDVRHYFDKYGLP